MLNVVNLILLSMVDTSNDEVVNDGEEEDPLGIDIGKFLSE